MEQNNSEVMVNAANKLSDDVDMSVVEKQSYDYYMKALANGEHIVEEK